MYILNIIIRLWHKAKFYSQCLLSIISTKKRKYKQIIICGIPRSGTSLIYTQVVKRLPYMTPVIPSKGRSKEVSGMNVIFYKKNTITKKPGDIDLIKKIKKYNFLKKNILFIITYRDIRDVLVSKHQWGNDEYYLTPFYMNTLSGYKDCSKGLDFYLKSLEKAKTIKASKFAAVEILKLEDFLNDAKVLDDLLIKNGFNISKTINFNKTIYSQSEQASNEPIKAYSKWNATNENIMKIKSDFSSNQYLMNWIIKYGYECDDKWYEKI